MVGWWRDGGDGGGQRRDCGAVVGQKQFSNWGFRVYKNLDLGKGCTHERKGERCEKDWVLF